MKFKIKGKKKSWQDENKIDESGKKPMLSKMKKKKAGRIRIIKKPGRSVEDEPTMDEPVEYKKIRRSGEARATDRSVKSEMEKQRIKKEKEMYKRILQGLK